MESESIDKLERRLAEMQMLSVSAALRGAVLGDVHRELAAARWDGRLARAAAVLLAIGVGMNLAIGWQSGGSNSAGRQIAGGPSRDALVQVAVTVAEATDAQTGRRFARQLAAMSGRELSREESAAIDAAVQRASTHTSANGDRG